MKTLRPILTMIMLTLSLSSCGGKIKPEKVVSINGDLLLMDEINYENCCYDVSFAEFDSLIKSNEKFVFYLTSSLCSHCEEFKDKMINFVDKTDTLVYRMDIIAEDKKGYSPEFELFLENYKQYFFVNEEIYTPAVYIVEGEKVADYVPSTRYNYKWMFKNAMKDYVQTGKNYSFSGVEAYKKFADARWKNSYMSIVIDRQDEEKRNLYSKYLSIIKASSLDVAIIDINSNNKEAFANYLNFIDIDSLTAFYSNASDKDVYVFSNNDEENKAFLNKYL